MGTHACIIMINESGVYLSIYESKQCIKSVFQSKLVSVVFLRKLLLHYGIEKRLGALKTTPE